VKNNPLPPAKLKIDWQDTYSYTVLIEQQLGKAYHTMDIRAKNPKVNWLNNITTWTGLWSQDTLRTAAKKTKKNVGGSSTVQSTLRS